MDVDLAVINAALARIQPQVGKADFDLIQRLVSTLAFVMRMLRAQRTTIARLRRFFGLSSSEKTADVLKPKPEPGRPAAGPPPAPPAGIDVPASEPPEPSEARGHGRLSASDYEAATHFPVLHQELTPGASCPGCESGKLFELKEPARVLRIVGQPLLEARCWDCQRLRCGACGHVYTAPAPQEAQGPKFDETAVSMIALCRYCAGLPHHRLEQLQGNLQTPIPSSTQWDVLDQSAPTFQPVFDELRRQAAQGSVIHDDDTYVRILAFMGKRRAELLQKGELPDPERTGLFTTAIVSLTAGHPIALFYTGRKYAAENLADLFQVRQADLAPPILMCDALDSRNVPKGHAVVESNCTAHARRGIVDQIPNFPSECEYVLEQLRKVFVVDAQCKQKGLSPEERLRVHQRESGPVMHELHQWMIDQRAQKRVEPNSGLGKAYWYMLKRWHKLTLFLHRPGAPIDNNICERALKRALCHRRNSLFFRSPRGAHVGDMFMSLIHTAELRGANPFDFLTEVQRHATAVADHPADWLPWTYRATLARLAQHAASPAPPRAPPPLRSGGDAPSPLPPA